MLVIREKSLYETDDYEEIQEAFEGYLYGSHRGLGEKEYDKGYELEDYIDIRYGDDDFVKMLQKLNKTVIGTEEHILIK